MMNARDQLRACFPALPPGESNDLVEAAVTELLVAAQREVRVAGAGEAALVLGVSTQRLHDLRRLSEFPTPHQVLATGPIWLVSDLEAYDRVRNKKRGPRPRVTEGEVSEIREVGTRYVITMPGRLWTSLRVMGALDTLGEGVLGRLRVTEKRYGRGTRVAVLGRCADLREVLAVIEAEAALGPAGDLGMETPQLRAVTKQAVLPWRG